MLRAERGARRVRKLIGSVTVLCVAAALLSTSALAQAAPVASVGDVTVTEGDGGTTNAVFTVTLTSSSGTTTVSYQTTNGTAVAGSDYTATSGTLTFSGGQTQQTVSVPVMGDTADEANETFSFTLTQITNGTFQGGDPNAVGTITDDDEPPSITAGDASVTEGNAGTTTVSVPVTLSEASGRTVTVDFVTADGTATFDPGADFHRASGRIAFSPGETVETITLTVVSDTIDESDENFFLDLFAPVNATLADGRGTITIVDDDGPGQPGGGTPLVTISDATVAEGNAGTVQTTVTVTLSKTSTESVAVDFTTADNTATFSGADYHSQSGRLVFAPGETSKTITLTIVGDTVDESNESFFVNLTNAVNATVSDGQGVVTITDDDSGTQPPPPTGSSPTISIGDATVAEGDSDETTAAVNVTLSAASTAFVAVDFSTTDGTATFAGADYWRYSGRLVFAPGETTKTLLATVVGDTIDENSEIFYIDLTDPENATIADSRGQVTITNDDDDVPPPGGLPSISISDLTLPEGDAGTATGTLTLTLSAPSEDFITVDFGTADGTATFDDADYWSTSGTLVFQPGETTETIQITINGDNQSEGDEVFYVDLSAPANATLGDQRAGITIDDDDGKAPSRIGLSVAQRARRLIARGIVIPPHPGDTVRVLLKKRRDGRFRTIAVKRPTLGDALDRDGDGVFESNFRTRFKRPRRGRCAIKAVFPGDADHRRSATQTSAFRC